jgi:hypothetical protein
MGNTIKCLTQTILHSKEKAGNCYPVTLACLLNIDIDQVPNFELLFNIYGRNEEKIDNILRQYFKDVEIEVSSLYFLQDTVKNIFLSSKGYKEKDIKNIDTWVKLNPDKYYMAFGTTSRGTNHVVICMNGKVIHDVHPSKEGLNSILEFKYLNKII